MGMRTPARSTAPTRTGTVGDHSTATSTDADDEGAALLLTSALAMDVVAALAPRVGRNVNLMDRRGVIIAALDPARIGTRHDGALRAARQGRTVVIDAQMPGSGDLPGVNEPLYVDGTLCGVVGVTGAPREVAELARVVALSVGLLVRQQRAQDGALLRDAATRDLLAGLSSGVDVEAADALLRDAAIPAPWRLDVLDLAADALAPAIARLNAGPAAAAALDGAVWVLRHAHAPVDLPEAAGFGADAPDAVSLLARAEDARLIARHPALWPEPDEVWSWEHAAAAAALPPISRRRAAASIATLAPAHLDTITAIAGARSLADAAATLHIHRNTLLQRIERISELVGADVREPLALSTMLLAVYAARAERPGREAPGRFRPRRG